MKAIILAAGKGSRLKPLTDHTPKPLIEVDDKAILDHIIYNLPDEVDEVIIITKHLAEKIDAHISAQSAKGAYKQKITLVPQGEHTGTYGALLSVKHLINDGERFFVMNGDDLHDKQELASYLQFPISSGIQKRIMPGYYSLTPDDDGVLRRFRPQTEQEKIDGAHIATGVYVLDSNIFNFPAVEIHGGELGLFQTIIAQSDTYPMYAVVTEKWQPINNLTELEEARKKFL